MHLMRLKPHATPRPGGRGLLRVAAGAVAFALVASGAVMAQRFFREGSFPPRWPPARMPDSSFVLCRLAYSQVRAEPSGIGWQTDYPYAEIMTFW